jgi:hypothetical protein
MNWRIILIIFFVSQLLSAKSLANNKMDLDDLQIKGELHNDDRLKILARQRNDMKNYVKFRTSYRKEMVEGLPKPKPKVKYTWK